MKLMYSKILVVVLAGLLVNACNPKPKDNTNYSETSDSTNVADLEYIEDFFDFGRVVQGEIVSHTFRFKNAGNAPLIIKDVIPSCGCTTSKLSKSTLKPGEEGTVEVIFNSEGWRGSQYKSVALRTNSPVNEKSVTIKANVVEADNEQ